MDNHIDFGRAIWYLIQHTEGNFGHNPEKGKGANMNLLSMRKCSWAMSGAFVAFLTFAAHGSANVFDDAVFWFRGGKDISGDGYMQQGEFFDDLHANDASHANHQMPMTSYTGNYKVFKEDGALCSEQVVFPALGTNMVEEMQVLRISNAGKREKSGAPYSYYPLYVDPRNVFAGNDISNEYTIVTRMRLDDDGVTRTQCVFKIGYDASAGKGMWVGFSEIDKTAKTKHITGRCVPSSNGNDVQFDFPDIKIPTNTWFDMAVVVGGGKLRVGVAFPNVYNENPTIVFNATNMWTDNCTLLDEGYRLFCKDGQSEPALQETADMTCFIGSVQQVAIWGRALSDQEVMAAFGMPRPAIFRTGFDNAASNEFGGERTGPTQTIDGLGSWQNIANTMKADDTWTVNFNALRDEANLAQIFSIKSLPDSAAAQIEVVLNGTTLGEGRVAADSRAFWPVAANIIHEGENELVIKRKDGRTRDFLIDAMELGGALGVGSANNTYEDGRVFPELIATGVPSAADPNLAHWPVGFRPFLNNNTNLHFRVWVDPDIVDVCASKFWTYVQCKQNGSSRPTGNEYFTIFVNGEAKTNFYANASWKNIAMDFDPGVLRGGWNDFEIRSEEAYKNCYWVFDRYRFETLLSDPFGFQTTPGMTIVIK